MKSNLKTSIIVAATSLLFTSTTVFADGHAKEETAVGQKNSTAFNLSELACWDVMTLEEADRDTILFLFYGYVSGVKGELKHDAKTIQKILRQLGEHCSENPDDLLLELMTKN